MSTAPSAQPAEPGDAEPGGASPGASDTGDADDVIDQDDPDALLDLPEDQQVFERGYLQKVRSQAARYRNERNELADKLKSYEDMFGVYEDEDQQVWKEMIVGWANDPVQTAKVMQAISASVLGDGSDPGGDMAAQESIEEAMSNVQDESDLTPDKVQEMITEAMSARDAAAAERAAVEGIYSEMREAGVDPNSREGMAVLWSANNETDGDIAKAVALVKGDKQNVIDEYVNGARTGTPTSPATGEVASAGQNIETWDDARKAADAYLRSRVGASSGESS